MADLYVRYERSPYFDRQSGMTVEEYHTAIEKSTCLYVGNLSYYTAESQIYEFFGRCGEVRRVVMGLDKFQKTPCGFCFVEYYEMEDAEAAIRYLNGMRLDDRHIRLDRDPGFKEGRQYGRGKSGGQVRDEYRMDFDLGRGGLGRKFQVAGVADIDAAQSASSRGRGGRYAEGGGHERTRQRSPRAGLPRRDVESTGKRARADDEEEDEGRQRRRRGRGDDSDSE